MAIPQGTTPTHTFNIPFDSNIIKTAHIAYSQCDKIVFVKKDEDIQMSGSKISTRLTQEDTLSLDPRKIVQIQLRILTVSGDALKTSTFLRSVDACLEKEVLT